MGKPLVVCEYAWLVGTAFTFNADVGLGNYVHTASLHFDLQDADHRPVGRDSVNVRLAATEAMLSVPEMLALVSAPETAAALDAAVTQAKADFAGYEPEEV